MSRLSSSFVASSRESYFRSLSAALAGFVLLISLKKREERIIRDRQIAIAQPRRWPPSLPSATFIAKEREQRQWEGAGGVREAGIRKVRRWWSDAEIKLQVGFDSILKKNKFRLSNSGVSLPRDPIIGVGVKNLGIRLNATASQPPHRINSQSSEIAASKIPVYRGVYLLHSVVYLQRGTCAALKFH